MFKISTIVLFVVLCAALVVGGVFYFRDTSAPTVTLSPASGAVSANRPLTLTLDDPSGLRNVKVTATQGTNAVPVLTRTYPQGVTTAKESIKLPTPVLKDGPFSLKVVAADRSIYHFGAGNTGESTTKLTYDNTPPTVSVLSVAHNITQGGSCLIVYTVSEDVQKTGMQVGDHFFPGYRQASGLYACLFTFPYNMKPADFVPQLIAIDEAGNIGHGSFYYHTIARKFTASKIKISDAFLAAKQTYFQTLDPQGKTPLDLFLWVNDQERAKDRAKLHRFGLETSPVPLWHGTFLRQPDAARMANFGDSRDYFYHGKKIDHQTHLGIDLASVDHAPIPASNDGKVVYAGMLGIYGQCVVLDHGLGLQTLYAHMSRIGVKVGDTVKKGQIIGHTGATGMAGGDHLHFGVIVSGVPVNPVEWWDPNWLRNNILKKFKLRPDSN
ncbi:MAG TPA: M23 family metallopeptidase [Desulfuromonadales bacterium]|nr:M23 family metallopeptidase [Desulfuromonadales bacterium]